jgi:uncharacterized membrane protein
MDAAPVTTGRALVRRPHKSDLANRQPADLVRELNRVQRQIEHELDRVQRQLFRKVSAERVARGLGWFSIGLGLAELIMPGVVGRLAGGRGKHTGLIRLFGLREIASGLAIFGQGRKPAAAVWSRVAGDALDLATLGLAAASPRTSKAGVAFATANVLGVTALDLLTARELSQETGRMTPDGAVRVRHSIAINRPPQEVYQFWKRLENWLRFMYHLQSVTVHDERRSHWVVKAPGGKTVEWESEIFEDHPNEFLAWRTLDSADVDHSGSVSFEPQPGRRGTIVRVAMRYSPPLGMAGAVAAKLFHESPEQQIRDDLRRMKQVIETGEVTRSDGSPQGRGQIWQRPAQPLRADETL